MSGFKDEKELWQYQRRRLRGKWNRYELITPSGHPDVKGSFENEIIYIENKVGEHDYKALEANQIAYIDWLQQCKQRVFICFGSRVKNDVSFWMLEPRAGLLRVHTPRFWSYTPIRR